MECTQTKPREFDRGATDRRRWRLSTRYLEEEEVEVEEEEEEKVLAGATSARTLPGGGERFSHILWGDPFASAMLESSEELPLQSDRGHPCQAVERV